MNEDPCQKFRDEVQAAARELKRSLEAPSGNSPASGWAQSDQAAMTASGVSIGRVTVQQVQVQIATSRYRAALRALAECLHRHPE